MFNALIDTCVWLDLAQDPKQTPLVSVVEAMVKEGRLSLIVPRVVYDEFVRNRARVAKASVRSLSGHFQQVRDAVNKATTDTKRRKALLAQLDELNHRIPLIGGNAGPVLDRIDKLLTKAPIIDVTEPAKLKAADRALEGRAPCHHENKNSIADAIVLETYFESVKNGAPGERFAFVTHNKSDFSITNGNQKLPHTDFSKKFSKIRSMYFIDLAELLKRVDSETFNELIWEQMWEQEPRGLTELLTAHEKLWQQVWYGRHKHREWMIEQGKIRLVSKREWEKGPQNNGSEIIDQIWRGALRAAKKTEKELGLGDLGPWDDFDWGMINGKLSAIRWVLGDDWDMLDT